MVTVRGPVETNGQVVYLLSVPAGYFKIGIARDPEQRRRDLQVGNPEPIALEGHSQMSLDGVSGIDAREMERDIHEFLREHHLRGEWFKAPVGDVYWAWKLAWTKQARPGQFARWKRRFAPDPAPPLVSVRQIAARVVRPPVRESSEPSIPGETRNARWRRNHPERYRDYMRDYMKRRRAKHAG